jgi:hypothetical protein
MSSHQHRRARLHGVTAPQYRVLAGCNTPIVGVAASIGPAPITAWSRRAVVGRCTEGVPHECGRFEPTAMSRFCPGMQEEEVGPPFAGWSCLLFLVLLYVYVRRCPTLPHRPRCSTIGAGGLNFRVRNGTGCFPTAMTTETFRGYTIRGDGSRSCSGNRIVNASRKSDSSGCCWGVFKSLGLLVPVNSTPCGASISGLSTQSSSWGPYNHEGWETSS